MTKSSRSIGVAIGLSLVLAGCISPTQSVVCSGCCCPPAKDTVVCIDFELPLTIRTQYGAPAGHSSGDVIFAANDIPVSVHDFTWMSGGGTFNRAYIDLARQGFGSGQTIRTNNINLQFDFSQLGFQPSQVQFEFLDTGGNENVSVNESPVLPLELTQIPGPLPVGGATLVVNAVSVDGNDKRGLVTITGAVQTLKTGGQEFWIDRVCVR